VIDIVDITLLAPPFTLVGTDPIPPSSDEDFRTALRAYLVDHPSLSTLAGVYWNRDYPGAPLPHLIFNLITKRKLVITTSKYYTEATYQFTILASDDEEAETLGEAAYDCLLPMAVNGPIIFAGGYEMGRSPGQARGPETRDDAVVGSDQVWMYHFDYKFTFGVA
jgi:hypothetical protein